MLHKVTMSALSYLVLKSSSADLSEHSRVSYFVLETNTTTGRDRSGTGRDRSGPVEAFLKKSS